MPLLNMDKPRGSYKTFWTTGNGEDPSAKPCLEISEIDQRPRWQSDELAVAPSLDVEKDMRNSLRALLFINLWMAVSVTIGCISLAINQWAGYVLLLPLAACSMLYTITYYSRLRPKDMRAHRIQEFKFRRTGSLPPRVKGILLPHLLVLIFVSCFSVAGMLATSKAFWGSWFPDISDDAPEEMELGPQFALWAWFSCLTLIGLAGCFGSVFGIVFAVCLHLARRSEALAATPQLPAIKNFQPLVWDSLISCNAIFISYSTFEVFPIPDGYDIFTWICLAGILSSTAWFVWQVTRISLYAEQIRLYVDWATDVDGVKVEPHITELLAEGEKLETKYPFSFIGLAPLYFQFIAFPIHRDETDWDESDWKTLGIVCISMFVFINLCWLAVWRLYTPRRTAVAEMK